MSFNFMATPTICSDGYLVNIYLKNRYYRILDLFQEIHPCKSSTGIFVMNSGFFMGFPGGASD